MDDLNSLSRWRRSQQTAAFKDDTSILIRYMEGEVFIKKIDMEKEAKRFRKSMTGFIALR